ncbi:hypothetical protein [Mucilaginibacter sp. KACC 22063]|uniref:hypothetical protein n=1 Tax=Mucilaginibacter sp. KACC 22063 TaxID=3025666 RepID=UPI002366CB0F|nr:hypothetical protein [Mucilaginibacter sp. KACC 22063]WDF54092.1 hypothetical protein PQ461_14185 [Mucilaginibacter sp. KACC 22063]
MNQKIYLLLFACLVIASCKKSTDFESLENQTNTTSSSKRTINGTPTPQFEWENADFMPMPSGSGQVTVPWGSGASRQIAPEILLDYKKIDGWELVYNTFNTSNIPDNLYFVLYNKYRGLLRMYLYIPSGANFINSSNIVHTLGIEGSYLGSSPIMNFGDQTIVNLNNNSPFASEVLQYQAAPATWYAFQYELAYDKNLKDQDYQKLRFSWPVKANQITSVTLNGVQKGTLDGNMNVPSTNLTISSSVSSTNANVIINGNSDVEKAKPSLTTTIFNSLKDLVTKKLTSLATGFVSNIFSGIFGGKSGSSDDVVHLKMNSTLQLTGTLSSNFLVSSTGLSIPGYDQTFTPGFIPNFNGKLGVFYLNNVPTVNEVLYKIPQTGPNGEQLVPKNEYVYTPDMSSINPVYNPDLLNIADIQNFRTEVVVVNSDMYQIDGNLETIGNLQYKTGSSVVSRDQSAGVVGIRVIFDVVPKNGATKSVIVKTFACNLSRSEGGYPGGDVN